MRWRRRNMLKMTGLPGWMRTGGDYGWGVQQNRVLPPMVNRMLSTGQIENSQREFIRQFYIPYPSLAYRYSNNSNLSANTLPVVPQIRSMTPFPVMVPLAAQPAQITPEEELDFLRKEKENLVEQLNSIEKRLKKLTENE